MDMTAVRRSYARWAPIYNFTFGAVTLAGRNRVTAMINGRGGSVLEVGVGTGMSLDLYAPHLRVTGIDASPEMLKLAEARVAEKRLGQVAALALMDARALEFGTAQFDHVVALHILSVVPDPERVVAEMARVCKPGGSIYIVNHFSRGAGVLGALERLFAPLAHLLGWHSDFPRETVMGCADLRLVEEMHLPPFGMMTLLRMTRVR